MKPITWMVMAVALALSACGGDDVATNGGASSSSPNTPGSPSGPTSPGGGSNGGSNGGPTGGGGTTQPQAGWSKAAAVDGNGPEGQPSVTIDASGNALAT